MVGLIAGRVLSDVAGWGLDFAMVAAFIGMVLPYLKDKPNFVAVFVAGVSAILFYGLPHKLGLIISTLLGIVAGVVAESRLGRQGVAGATPKGGV